MAEDTGVFSKEAAAEVLSSLEANEADFQVANINMREAIRKERDKRAARDADAEALKEMIDAIPSTHRLRATGKAVPYRLYRGPLSLSILSPEFQLSNEEVSLDDVVVRLPRAARLSNEGEDGYHEKAFVLGVVSTSAIASSVPAEFIEEAGSVRVKLLPEGLKLRTEEIEPQESAQERAE